MLDMQHRAVSAVREWNARLGKDATYLVCSHGDVIKAIVADSLGLHLDQSQRIVADPCSLTVIRYTPLRPFLLRLNDTGGGVDDLLPRPQARGRRPCRERCRDRRRRGCGYPAGDALPYPPRPGTAQARKDRTHAGLLLRPAGQVHRRLRRAAGDRTFYLQATSAGRVTSVVLEKFQVSLLAERIDELLDEVLRRTGDAAEIPETAPAALRDDGPLDLPLTEDFRVGAIALAWDSDGDRVVIEAQEESDAPVEPLSDDIPVDGPGVLRVRITPSAARAFAQRALKLVAAGRPPCPLCGLPLDASGHVCPRQNGHRAARA